MILFGKQSNIFAAMFALVSLILSTSNAADEDVKELLDEWMDNRWNGHSSEPLVQVINAAGLTIGDVEKLLLKGRSQYPDAPDPLGTIVSGKIINPEHVALFRYGAGTSIETVEYHSEYVIYVPTSYKKNVPAPLIIFDCQP